MADADTIYRVLTVYDADASRAHDEVHGLTVTLGDLLHIVERVKGVIEHIVELDSAAESAQIAMAGLINAAQFPGSSNFNTSMAMSSALMKQMRQDAAALSGTYEQMQGIFQATIPIAHEAGKSLMESERLSGRLMEFGNTFKISPDFVGREFRQMMEGRASVRNALFKDLSMFMGGMSGQQFNALSEPEKWKKVESALQRFDPMFKRVGETFQAQATTAESYFNQLVRIGSGEMFEGLKAELKAVNDWYTKNQAAVDEWVKKAGHLVAENMVAGFRILRDAVAFIVEHKDALIRIAEAYAVFRGFQGLGGGGIIPGRSTSAPSFGQVLGGGMFGLSMSALTNTTNSYSRALMVAEGALGQMPGIIGVIGQAALGLQSVLQAFANEIDEDQKRHVELRGDIGDPLWILKRYEAGGSSMSTGFGGRAMGENVASFLEAHKLVDKLGNADSSKIRNYLAVAVGEGAMDNVGAKAFFDMAMKANPYMHHHAQMFGPAAPTEEQKAQQLLLERGKPVQIHNTNVVVYQQNTIYDAEDPARVVSALGKELNKAINRPSQSPSVLNPYSTNGG